jgi:hypothetical protein
VIQHLALTVPNGPSPGISDDTIKLIAGADRYSSGVPLTVAGPLTNRDATSELTSTQGPSAVARHMDALATKHECVTLFFCDIVGT